SKAVDIDGDLYRGFIPVSEHVLVFADTVDTKEVERTLSSHLDTVIQKVSSTKEKKCKLYVVH
ncbi:MAG: hypothetical protein V4492_04685, partial [Chlamydiota bacterium]